MVKRSDGCEMKPAIAWKVWSATDARDFVQIPHESDDKYSRGVLGVIAGSDQYPGSAVLSCDAALRTGIGMVRFFGPEKSQMLVLNSSPEVVIQDGKVQAWVIGPGLDTQKLDSTRRAFIESALNQNLPTLIDAGALSFLSNLIIQPNNSLLITPHYRELSRLFALRNIMVSSAQIESSPKEWAVRAAKEWQVCVLLKGVRTLIATPATLLELPSATPWLATAGTGDVLAGIIGGLIATQTLKITEDSSALASISATGALIHAQAAERASRRGPISASTIIGEIPSVVKELIS